MSTLSLEGSFLGIFFFSVLTCVLSSLTGSDRTPDDVPGYEGKGREYQEVESRSLSPSVWGIGNYSGTRDPRVDHDTVSTVVIPGTGY